MRPIAAFRVMKLGSEEPLTHQLLFWPSNTAVQGSYLNGRWFSEQGGAVGDYATPSGTSPLTAVMLLEFISLNDFFMTHL